MANEDATPDVQRTIAAGEIREPARPVPKIYSAPRRFDIATLLTVSFAYSLLLTSIRLLDAHWAVFAFVGGLTVVVALAQVLFERPRYIRAASVIAGALYILVWVLILFPWVAHPAARQTFLVSGLILGPLIGYVTGVLVGGVFLVADAVRRRIG